jgi:hypothetical protein
LSPRNYIYGAPDVGNSTSYAVGYLQPGSTYYFSVMAVNGCMPSGYSNEWKISVGRDGIINPVNLTSENNFQVYAAENEYNGNAQPNVVNLPDAGETTPTAAKSETPEVSITPAVLDYPVYDPNNNSLLYRIGQAFRILFNIK